MVTKPWVTWLACLCLLRLTFCAPAALWCSHLWGSATLLLHSAQVVLSAESVSPNPSPASSPFFPRTNSYSDTFPEPEVRLNVPDVWSIHQDFLFFLFYFKSLITLFSLTDVCLSLKCKLYEGEGKVYHVHCTLNTRHRNIFPEKELKTLQMFVDQMVYLPIQSVPASFFKKLI